MAKHKQTKLRRYVERSARLLTMPFWLSYQAQARLLGKEYACIAVSQRAATWTGPLGIYLRRALFKQILARVGEEVAISMGTILTKPTIEIGNHVYLGSFCSVSDVRIGDHTLISDHVSIIGGNHGMRADRLIREQAAHYRTIHIGEDCWVGNRAVILADLGAHCVVGAGSVVTKPVAPYQIVAGNPARPIGDRRTKGNDAPAAVKAAIHRNERSNSVDDALVGLPPADIVHSGIANNGLVYNSVPTPATSRIATAGDQYAAY